MSHRQAIEAVMVSRMGSAAPKASGPEAEALRQLLLRQRQQIRAELSGKQLTLDFQKKDDDLNASEKAQKKQLQLDRESMEQRLIEVEDELQDEPAQIEDLYNVALPRLEPVGLVYLWPGMM